jgi:hypothetical protein
LGEGCKPHRLNFNDNLGEGCDVPSRGEGWLRIAFVFITLALLVNISFAASTSVDITKIAVGARSLAMGRVSAADPGNINSLFINPANAADFKNWGVTSMYTSLLEGDISYTMLGGAKEMFGGTLGLAYLGGSSAGLNVTTLDADLRVAPTGTTFDYANSTITLAYGKVLNEKTSIGGSLKLMSKSFGSQGSGNGYGLDLGVLYKFKENLNLGLTIQNAISSLNWGSANEGTPLGIKGGLNFNVRDNLLLAADADLTPMALHAGVEWKPMALLAVRGGLERIPTGNSSTAMNMTAGVGLDFKGIGFDYAYFIDGALAANSTHYFTLSFLPPAAAEVKPAEKPAAKPVIAPAPIIRPPMLKAVPAKIKKPAPVKKKAPARKKAR